MTKIQLNEKEKLIASANTLRWEIGESLHDSIIESIYTDAAKIANKVVKVKEQKKKYSYDQAIDRIVTSKWLGFPIMFLMLSVVFWVTIEGANVPSGLIANLLVDTLHPVLKDFASSIGTPSWLSGVLIDGAYLAMAWVISVMLPPMAIFFPLFTLLEDFGYLPRVAFNLDNFFKKAGAHGRQSLTMVMGFGCNAAGVVATRIIDSPRERLIAIITNNFALCNSRWPTQILIAGVFLGALVSAQLAGLVSAASVVAIALLGVGLTLVASWVLSRTMLKGQPSTFSLELPPYRPPRVFQTLYTSLIDRTIYILWRAIVFAAPAGLVIWLVANVHLGGPSLAEILVNLLDPVGLFIGLNGVILLAYIVAVPANEIVIPTILMLTVLMTGVTGVGQGAGGIFQLDSQQALQALLTAGGWTLLTAINLMLFSLIHNPCSTTIYTIYKETGSLKWTAVATLMPLILGFSVTFVIAQVWHLLAVVL